MGHLGSQAVLVSRKEAASWSSTERQEMELREMEGRQIIQMSHMHVLASKLIKIQKTNRLTWKVLWRVDLTIKIDLFHGVMRTGVG